MIWLSGCRPDTSKPRPVTTPVVAEEMFPSMPKISKILLLTVSVALVLTVFLGANPNGVDAASTDQDGAYRQINVYTEVLDHIQHDYVTDPNITAVTNGAMRGLLESLDADSSYLTPQDYKIYLADKGGKAQVGINVSKRFGYATVVSVVPGSPAEKAGLTDGDILEAIEGKDTRNISLAMIREMLEGAPGSTLTLGVVGHDGKVEPEKMQMTRTVVTVPAVVDTLPPVVDQLYENTGILYLKPEILDHEHVQQVEAKLKAMAKMGDKKVLIDLRDVAAGDMGEATRMANFFLKGGTIASLEGQKFPKQVFTAEHDGPGGGAGEPWNGGAGRAGCGGAGGQQARRGGGREDVWRGRGTEDVRAARRRGADSFGGEV